MRFSLGIMLSLTLCMPGLVAQDILEVPKPELTIEGEELIIEFDLPPENSAEYKVELIARGEKDGMLSTRHCVGDIGKEIQAGRKKSIRWNLNLDNINLDQSISVRVLAYPLKKRYSRGELLLGSAIIPGLGPSLVSNSKPYWITSLFVYAGMGTTVYFINQAESNYQLYLEADNRSDNENYFETTQTMNKYSRIGAYSSIGLWAANMFWSMVVPKTPKYIDDKKDLLISIKPEPAFQGAGASVALTYTF